MSTSSEGKTEAEKGHTLLHQLGMKGFLLMEWGMRRISMKTLARIGRAAGAAAWHFLPGRRRITGRNLRIVLDSCLCGKELDELTKENFKRTIANFLCSAKTATLTDEQLKEAVTIRGHDEFARPVLEGKGLVCAVAHSGNWEALARIRVFYPEIERYGSMYRKFDNPLLEEYVYKRRTERGTQMFSKESGIRAPMSLLKKGAALGVLSDQFVNEGVFVPFFGKITGTTPLPALLRKRTGAEMAAVTVWSDTIGHWIAEMGDKVDFSGSDGTPAGDTIVVNRFLEQQIRKSVLDEFWMHHRWKSFDDFAGPQDAKVAELLETMDLKPFRIVVALPDQLEEGLLTIPLLRALKRARCDMQVNVICPSAQADFWKTVDVISFVLPDDDRKTLEAALAEKSFYNDGPLDMGVILNEKPLVMKALKPYTPMLFSCLASNPLRKKYKFRVCAPVLKEGSPGHRIQVYLRLAAMHGLDVSQASLFPMRKPSAAPDAPILLMPFSTLGSADEWGDDRWEEMVSRLSQPAKVVALPEDVDRAEALAERLGIPYVVGSPDELLPVLDEADAAVSVDGVFPALCSYRGLPTVTLFASRIPEVYRPLGQFHRSLHKHQCCSPCFRKTCDRVEPCIRRICPDDVLAALRELAISGS